MQTHAGNLTTHGHHRNVHCKRRSPAFAFTVRSYRAAVQFNDGSGNRQPQAKAPMRSCCNCITLTEGVKNVRKKLWPNTFTGIADPDFNVRIHSLQYNLDAALLWSELDRIR